MKNKTNKRFISITIKWGKEVTPKTIIILIIFFVPYLRTFVNTNNTSLKSAPPDDSSISVVIDEDNTNTPNVSEKEY